MEHNEKEQYAPGIESYKGSVPAWLVIVYISLFIWGIYYLVKYWNGP